MGFIPRSGYVDFSINSAQIEPHPSRIGVRVAFARLADQSAEGLEFALLDVLHDLRVRGQKFPAECDERIGADLLDAQRLHGILHGPPASTRC